MYHGGGRGWWALVSQDESKNKPDVDRTLLKRSFPFGPFMLVGALVGLVWGTLLAGRLWG